MVAKKKVMLTINAKHTYEDMCTPSHRRAIHLQAYLLDNMEARLL